MDAVGLDSLDHHVGPSVRLYRNYTTNSLQVLQMSEVSLMDCNALDARTVLYRHNVITWLGMQHVDRHATSNGDTVDLLTFGFQCRVEGGHGFGILLCGELVGCQVYGITSLFLRPFLIRITGHNNLNILYRICIRDCLLRQNSVLSSNLRWFDPSFRGRARANSVGPAIATDKRRVCRFNQKHYRLGPFIGKFVFRSHTHNLTFLH